MLDHLHSLINFTAVQKEICCDICNPKLFDHVRPSRPVRATRQKGIRKGPPVDSVRESLFKWRREIKKMHYPFAIFAPHAILDDATCKLLASIGPVENIEPLEQLLQSSWSRWDELGNQLYVYMKGLDIPALPPPAPRKKPAPASYPLPVTTLPSPSVPQPAAPSSQAGSASKRVHPTHSTALDDAANTLHTPDTRHPFCPSSNARTVISRLCSTTECTAFTFIFILLPQYIFAIPFCYTNTTSL